MKTATKKMTSEASFFLSSSFFYNLQHVFKSFLTSFTNKKAKTESPFVSFLIIVLNAGYQGTCRMCGLAYATKQDRTDFRSTLKFMVKR